MIGAGIPKAQLMDSETMARVLTRMAHEIMERAGDLQDLILVGIRRRGVPLAQRLADVIEKVEGVRVPVGELDITLYRDDLSKLYDQPKVNQSKLDMPITGKTVVLVDDGAVYRPHRPCSHGCGDGSGPPGQDSPRGAD